MNVLLDRNRPSAEFPETLERNAGRAPPLYRRSRVGAGSAGERGRHVCVPPPPHHFSLYICPPFNTETPL